MVQWDRYLFSFSATCFVSLPSFFFVALLFAFLETPFAVLLCLFVSGSCVVVVHDENYLRAFWVVHAEIESIKTCLSETTTTTYLLHCSLSHPFCLFLLCRTFIFPFCPEGFLSLALSLSLIILSRLDVSVVLLFSFCVQTQWRAVSRYCPSFVLLRLPSVFCFFLFLLRCSSRSSRPWPQQLHPN